MLWLGFLAFYASGDMYCFDPATGMRGIDALGHCASHDPLGVPVAISDEWPIWTSFVVPLVLATVWWPFRPWRKRG